MKVKNTIKKVGAAAGSALMVGMTMGAAASLADFPQPFVDGDGEVMSQVVVGSQGNVADVVGAVNIASALGQSAVQTQEQTVSTSGSGFGWSAAEGVSLDTRNDNLYYGSSLNDVRETLTASHLDTLADTTFRDDAGTTTDIEYFLYPGSQSVQFTQADDDEDPVLNVDNPASVTNSNYLYRLSANFEDSIAFNSTDVEDEDIELFGRTYTVSTDTTASDLVLLGSQEETSLETGESTTLTLGGDEVEIELVAVTSSNTAAFRVDGQLREKNEDQSFNVNGQDVRLADIIQTNSQTSDGLVTFGVGSEEITMMDGDQIQDDNGDDIDGTYVEFNGGGGTVDDLSSIDVYVGAEDSNHDWVAAGESYSHSLFENIEFHFGGLNPDAGEGAGDNVGEVEFSTASDDKVTASFTTSGGDSSTIEWAHSPDVTSGSQNLELESGDEDDYVVVEGEGVMEDQYVFTDAGDFAHLWQVTDVDLPTTPTASGGNDEATVELQDANSGQSVEVELDEAATTADEYLGTEIIDGKQYSFRLVDNDNGDETDDGVEIVWGTNSQTSESGDTDVGDELSVFPALDLESGSALTLADDVTFGTAHGINASSLDVVVPSTESTDAQSFTVSDNSGGTVDISTGGSTVHSGIANAASPVTVTVGQVTYSVSYTATEGSETVDGIALNASQNGGSGTNGVDETAPTAVVMEQEDDSDNEHAYIETPTLDTSNDEVNVEKVSYSGTWSGFTALDSDDDVEATYDMFGAHTMFDSNSQNTMTLHLPDGQAVAGAAVTGMGGDLSAGGSGGGTVSYTELAGMGNLPNLARTDAQVTDSVRTGNHLILVGGPAVNTLVADLASAGETWTQQTWLDEHEGEALVQLVEDAFTDGKHAMVVAGYDAEGTQAAARYVQNYADHAQELSDATDNTLVLSEADYPSTN